MYRHIVTASLASLLILVVGCDQLVERSEDPGVKSAFSLCPKDSSAKQQLFDLLHVFANEQGATISDRGLGATRELSGMGETGREVLQSTDGDLVLLTIEKPKAFRISLSNLGLKEKSALSIRYFDGYESDSRVEALMNDIERSWTVEPVEGGVGNDPPCDTALT